MTGGIISTYNYLHVHANILHVNMHSSKLPYTWKFSAGENFRHSLLLAKFLLYEFLSCVTKYIEDMVSFTALAKICSTEYFCNTKVAGIGKIFVQRKICCIQYTFCIYM